MAEYHGIDFRKIHWLEVKSPRHVVENKRQLFCQFFVLWFCSRSKQRQVKDKKHAARANLLLLIRRKSVLHVQFVFCLLDLLVFKSFSLSSLFRGRPFNSWWGGGGGGWFLVIKNFFSSNLVRRIFFSLFSHKLSITFVLHAIFSFRQALAGNVFAKSPTPPPPLQELNGRPP